jgi:DNA-binding response OmpR family regulator
MQKQISRANERKRIMVVDDDQNMLKLLNRVLDMEGYDPIIFSDGNMAVTSLNDVVPDLIILDIMMPGIDGLQTLNLIREHSMVPVIMLTARHEVELLQKSIDMGADDYIDKPFNIRLLVARIQAKLRRSAK